jgi:hypothetical protein
MAEHCCAECHVCRLSHKLCFTYKPFMLTVIMLEVIMLIVVAVNVVAPNSGLEFASRFKLSHP